jgi:hypothetical protein
MNTSTPKLVDLQHWMLAAITQPDGIIDSADLDRTILPSRQQLSAERLAVYSNAYFARLLEVLRELFPCTRFAVGDELFDQFAVGYLQQNPPHSYTLSRLADKLVDYLDASRPADWGAFLVEVACLEQAIDRIFDGPGPEGLPPFELPTETDGDLSLTFVSGFELLAFRFPTSTYYTDWKAGREPQWPEAGEQYVALLRRDFIVRRFEVSPVQYKLLQALRDGQPLSVALALVGANDNLLPADVRQWFTLWAQAGFFTNAR